MLRREVAGPWAKLDIKRITRREIIALLDGIVDRGSPYTANRVHRLIRRLMNWCVDRGIIETSPCVRLKAPAAETSRDRVLTDDEIRWFWQTAEGYGYPFGPLYQLLLLTGQRRDEVADLSVVRARPRCRAVVAAGGAIEERQGARDPAVAGRRLDPSRAAAPG